VCTPSDSGVWLDRIGLNSILLVCMHHKGQILHSFHKKKESGY
jgi:hypothetical protein